MSVKCFKSIGNLTKDFFNIKGITRSNYTFFSKTRRNFLFALQIIFMFAMLLTIILMFKSVFFVLLLPLNFALLFRLETIEIYFKEEDRKDIDNNINIYLKNLSAKLKIEKLQKILTETSYIYKSIQQDHKNSSSNKLISVITSFIIGLITRINFEQFSEKNIKNQSNTMNKSDTHSVATSNIHNITASNNNIIYVILVLIFIMSKFHILNSLILLTF